MKSVLVKTYQNTSVNIFSDASFLYTSKAALLKELDARKFDETLKIKTEKNNQNLTPGLAEQLNEPRLIFFRQVATPLHETLHILEIARELNIKPLILEFSKDIFVSKGNFYKKSLGKLPVYKQTNKHGRDLFAYHTIVDFNKYAGGTLAAVQTLNNESLISFHHELFQYVTGIDPKTIIYDASEWFEQFDYQAENYYYQFLSFFLKDHVLAEIFHVHGEEKRLSKNVVIPAFQKLTQEYSIKPLIFNYQPKREQTRLYWDCYPNKVNEFLEKKGYS